MALRKIINYLNDDVLRKKSKTVEAVDHKTLVLLRDMAETMYAANGAGLAAVQVGILRRMVVIDDGTGLIKLINPVIVEAQENRRDMKAALAFRASAEGLSVRKESLFMPRTNVDYP